MHTGIYIHPRMHTGVLKIPVCIRGSHDTNPRMHTGIKIDPHMHMGSDLNLHMHTGIAEIIKGKQTL